MDNKRDVEKELINGEFAPKQGDSQKVDPEAYKAFGKISGDSTEADRVTGAEACSDFDSYYRLMEEELERAQTPEERTKIREEVRAERDKERASRDSRHKRSHKTKRIIAKIVSYTALGAAGALGVVGVAVAAVASRK